MENNYYTKNDLLKIKSDYAKYLEQAESITLMISPTGLYDYSDSGYDIRAALRKYEVELKGKIQLLKFLCDSMKDEEKTTQPEEESC